MSPKEWPVTKITNKDAPEGTSLQAYALVELYGHMRIVGAVTVDPAEFPGMLRVDVPNLLKDGKVVRDGFTRYFGRGALYSVTPIDHAAMLELLPEIDGKPHRPMSFETPEDNGRW